MGNHDHVVTPVGSLGMENFASTSSQYALSSLTVSSPGAPSALLVQNFTLLDRARWSDRTPCSGIASHEAWMPERSSWRSLRVDVAQRVDDLNFPVYEYTAAPPEEQERPWAA